MNKESYLKNIDSSIDFKGHYIAAVLAGPQPAFVYSIGLLKQVGFELVFCGGSNYTLKQLEFIVDLFCNKINISKNIDQKITTEKLGVFSLVHCHDSWCNKTALGVYDYYKTGHINLVQIVPEDKNRLLDVPDMSVEWSKENGIWKWLDVDWFYNVPERSTVITNFNALRGEPVTEISKWEDDEWEMFAGAGPDVAEEDIRIVPLGTMLGIDKTIEASLDLEIGKGIWRESRYSSWQKWG